MQTEVAHLRERPVQTLLETTWLVFGTIGAVYLITTYLTNTLVLTDQVYLRTIGDNHTIDQLDAFYSLRVRFTWVGYVLFPLLLFAKVGYATVCISVGAILADIDVQFKHVFGAVLVGELVFLLAAVLRFVSAFWIVDVATLDDYSGLMSLSLLEILNDGAVAKWLHYPLRTLNVYELAFAAVTAAMLSDVWAVKFSRSILIVLLSYGLGLLLWITAVAFLLLQIA